MKATQTVHWVSGPVDMCDEHARKAVNLGNFLGTHVACTPCNGEDECSNCENETKKGKRNA